MIQIKNNHLKILYNVLNNSNNQQKSVENLAIFYCYVYFLIYFFMLFFFC